jgi:hypothetical protein
MTRKEHEEQNKKITKALDFLDKKFPDSGIMLTIMFPADENGNQEITNAKNRLSVVEFLVIVDKINNEARDAINLTSNISIN